MSDTEAPPAPAEAPPEPRVEDDAAPLVPETEPTVEAEAETTPRAARRRGVPIEPLVIGAGNGTAMAATAAYQALGPAGLAGAASAVVALAAGGALQRRRTVRRRTTAAAGRPGPAGTSNRGRRRGEDAGRGGAGGVRRGALGTRAAGRIKTPRVPTPALAGKQRRPKTRRAPSTSPSTTTYTPRRGGRGGRLRPATSAARRGMATSGRALRATGRSVRAAGQGAVRGGRRIAAPARAAWRRSATARRAAARHIRRAAAGLWDGSIATLAGVASAVRHRSLRAGLERMRAVWRRRRSKRAAKRAADGPTMTGRDVAETPPPVATSVRRPATAGGSPSTHGAPMSGGHHFLAPAMELERIATTYSPDGMMQVGRDFAALPDALEHIANAMKISTARADAEQPLDPRVIEIMQGIYRLQIKAAELARELTPAFRKLHDLDIARIEAPRKGRGAEAMWDVSRNADTTL